MDLHTSHDAGPAAPPPPPPPPALQSFDRFFDLPQELQEHVLGFLVPQNARILIGPPLSASLPPGRGVGDGDGGGRDSNDDEDGSISWQTATTTARGRRARQGCCCRPRRIRDVPPPAALRLAHPLLGALAGRMYWAHNEFHLNFLPAAETAKPDTYYTNGDDEQRAASSSSSSEMAAAAAAAAPHAFLSSSSPPQGSAGAEPSLAARRLVVYVRRLDERLWAGRVCAALERLVLRGGLRALEVRVLAGGAGGEPLARLARVLADPDLDLEDKGRGGDGNGGAALRVWRRGHKAFWCRFHARRDGGGCGTQKCGSSSAAAAAAGVGGGVVVVGDDDDDEDDDDEWLSIDVPALVREYGGDAREGKIVRVGGRFTGY
ncbi:uncharacterized protein E0L32_011725 [Thyridium curvatum]|uniref:Uncharacterized protein n=1 Tax=Thyridium curvatum TaxID=1093900 RepID=A0A507B7T4_9PEZI|nr:uncharacterized protein E0L32_011725 [Thyridium curvatum]TPX18392.1 hypothetical protein E0L32_011725 [Thyridium curvatum]